jgi:hypothetical protein
MLVKLTSSRVGHKFDKEGRFVGVFSEAAGQEVEMANDEAKRYIEKGLANPVEKAK